MKVSMFSAGEVKLLPWGCCLRVIVGICSWAARIPLQYLLLPGPVETTPVHYRTVLQGGTTSAGVWEALTDLVWAGMLSRDAEQGCWALPGGLEDDGFCQQHVKMPVPLPPGSHWSAQARVECLSSVPCSGSQQPLTFGSMAPASLCCSFLSCKSCKIPLTSWKSEATLFQYLN